MAGLLDQYKYAGNAQALNMTKSMVDYFYNRVQSVISKHTIERHWLSLNEETGGMNDVLYSLYRITVISKLHHENISLSFCSRFLKLPFLILIWCRGPRGTLGYISLFSPICLYGVGFFDFESLYHLVLSVVGQNCINEYDVFCIVSCSAS